MTGCAQSLGPFGRWMRVIYSVPVRGRRSEIRIYDVGPDVTLVCKRGELRTLGLIWRP